MRAGNVVRAERESGDKVTRAEPVLFQAAHLPVCPLSGVTQRLAELARLQ